MRAEFSTFQDACAEVARLRARVQAVRDIHAPIDAIHEPTGKAMQVCAGCGRDRDWMPWPCPTIRALDKETHHA